MFIVKSLPIFQKKKRTSIELYVFSETIENEIMMVMKPCLKWKYNSFFILVTSNSLSVIDSIRKFILTFEVLCE